MHQKRTHRLHICLTQREHDTLKRLAESTSMSMSMMTRNILRKALEAQLELVRKEPAKCPHLDSITPPQ
jgi:hypothetical protein